MSDTGIMTKKQLAAARQKLTSLICKREAGKLDLDGGEVRGVLKALEQLEAEWHADQFASFTRPLLILSQGAMFKADAIRAKSKKKK
jgi:predicted transcriptional regulator